MSHRLDEKLAEYRESGAIEEVIDLVEIIRAIAEHQGVNWSAFEQKMKEKRRDGERV